MTKVQARVQIDASPEEVWEVIEDLAGHVDWMTDAVAIRFTSRRRSGVGTTFECDTRIGPFRLTDRMEVTAWQPPRSMGVTHTGLVTGAGRFTLRRRRGGTRFEWKERLRFPWTMGGPLGALVAKPLLRMVWRRNVRSLKAKVEGGRA